MRNKNHLLIDENNTIILPTLKKQKKIVKKLEKKVRTSFELTEDSLKKLEAKADELNINTSQLLGDIISSTTVKPNDLNQKRLKNFTMFQHNINRINRIGESLIPAKYSGKRGVNKSFVVELILQEYFYENKKSKKPKNEIRDDLYEVLTCDKYKNLSLKESEYKNNKGIMLLFGLVENYLEKEILKIRLGGKKIPSNTTTYNFPYEKLRDGWYIVYFYENDSLIVDESTSCVLLNPDTLEVIGTWGISEEG